MNEGFRRFNWLILSIWRVFYWAGKQGVAWES